MSSVPMNRGAMAPAVSNVQQLLAANMTAIKSALPKHLTPERMCRVALQTIQRTPQLQRCSPHSLVAAIVEASGLGLEIDVRGLAYLVPYKDTVTLIPGYKGLMDLAYRSGRVATIYAEVVCENDAFDYVLGLTPDIKHKPALANRGKPYAVYAVAKLKDADPVFVVLGKDDVEKVRRSSKASANGPWKDWESEMWKKTAIRRLCKYLPLSPEMARAIAIDEAADAGVTQNLGADIIDLPEPAHTATNTVDALNNALASDAPTYDVEPPVEQAPEPMPEEYDQPTLLGGAR